MKRRDPDWLLWTTYVLLLLLFALCSCATPSGPPPVKIVTVDRPVAVSCVPADLPPPPEYPDTRDALLAALSPVERAVLLERGWGIKESRLRALEGVVAACKMVPAKP